MTSAVASLLSAGEQFFKAVVTDVKDWAGDVETIVVDDAKVGWLALQPILTAIGPGQWVILQDLVSTANTDLAADDYAGIVTDVLSRAVTDETKFLVNLSLSTLTVMVTALQGSKVPS